MSEERKAREDEVFDQELSMDDLSAAAGGEEFIDIDNCKLTFKRQIYGGQCLRSFDGTEEEGSCRGAMVADECDYHAAAHLRPGVMDVL